MKLYDLLDVIPFETDIKIVNQKKETLYRGENTRVNEYVYNNVVESVEHKKYYILVEVMDDVSK